MSDTTPTELPTAINDVVAEVENPESPENPEEDEHQPGREAAKYRRQLREVETHRDALAAQLDALRRAEVGRLAAAASVKPEAIWAAGHELNALLADDGTVSADLVAAAIAATREAFGIRPLPAAPPATGQGNVGKPIGDGAPVEKTPTWADVFRA